VKDLRTVLEQKENEIAQTQKEIEILRAALAILEDTPETVRAAVPIPMGKAVGSDVKIASVIAPTSDGPKRAFIP